MHTASKEKCKIKYYAFVHAQCLIIIKLKSQYASYSSMSSLLHSIINETQNEKHLAINPAIMENVEVLLMKACVQTTV